MDKQTEILRNISPADKLKQAQRIYWSARKYKEAWIRSQNPDLSNLQITKLVRDFFIYART